MGKRTQKEEKKGKPVESIDMKFKTERANRKARFAPILYFGAAMQRTINANGNIATVLFIFYVCPTNGMHLFHFVLMKRHCRQSKRTGETHAKQHAILHIHSNEMTRK